MAGAEGTRRHHEVCVEVKRSREGGVSVRGSRKKLDGFTPKGYLDCVLHVKVFWYFGQMLIHTWRGCWGSSPFFSFSFGGPLFYFES